MFLDWERWAEWRLLVGRARAEATERGPAMPAALAHLGRRLLAAVREKIEKAGFLVSEGLIARDAEAVDGVFE